MSRHSLDESSFDVCIAGTGLPECLVAASLSSRGYRVLQIDRSNFYGEGWASLNLTSFDSWINEEVICKEHSSEKWDNGFGVQHEKSRDENANREDDIDIATHKEESCVPENVGNNIGERIFFEEMMLEEFYRTLVQPKISDHRNPAFSTKDTEGKEKQIDNYPALFCDRRIWYNPFNSDDGCSNNQENAKKIVNELSQQSNRFNFDLSPKMLYSESPIISILVTSGVARYLDFRGIDEFNLLLPKLSSTVASASISDLFPLPLLFETPPVSKGAIFKNKSLTLVEKRNLMKFITTFALKENPLKGTTTDETVHFKKKDQDAQNKELTRFSNAQSEAVSEELSQSRNVSKMPVSGLSSFLSTASTYSVSDKELKSFGQYALGNSEDEKREQTATANNRSWACELQEYKLSLGLRHRITYGICLKNHLESVDRLSANNQSLLDDTLTDWPQRIGFERLHLVASSFGKYSDGSFILPTFGSGDLAQAFARLSAVYRGVFMLRTDISHVIFEVESTSNKNSHETQLSKPPEILSPLPVLNEAPSDDTEHSLELQGVISSIETDNSPNSDSECQLPIPSPLRTQFINGKKLAGIKLTNGKEIEIKRLIASLDNIRPQSFASAKKNDPTCSGNFRNLVVTSPNFSHSTPLPQIARLVAVVNGALLPGRDGFQCCVCILPSQHPIQLLQLNWNSGCCPINHYLIYMTQVVASVSPANSCSQLNRNVLDAPLQYTSMIELLQQLLLSRSQTKCLMLGSWTQNIRIAAPQYIIPHQFYLMPDPISEGASIILNEVDVATETICKLLDQPSLQHLIPLPPHVGAERHRDLVDAANRPFEELEEIIDTPLLQLNSQNKSIM